MSKRYSIRAYVKATGEFHAFISNHSATGAPKGSRVVIEWDCKATAEKHMQAFIKSTGKEYLATVVSNETEDTLTLCTAASYSPAMGGMLYSKGGTLHIPSEACKDFCKAFSSASLSDLIGHNMLDALKWITEWNRKRIHMLDEMASLVSAS